MRNSRPAGIRLERAADFSVTMPAEDASDALSFFGRRSGRAVNTFEMGPSGTTGPPIFRSRPEPAAGPP
jgi:hypothetical protein